VGINVLLLSEALVAEERVVSVIPRLRFKIELAIPDEKVDHMLLTLLVTL
jgi:hypothetical protein